MFPQPISATAPSSSFSLPPSQSTANIVMSLFPLWSHDLPGVAIPEQLLFLHIPLHHTLIRRWVESDDVHLGGLLFPRGPFEMASQDPFVQVLKSGAMCRRGKRAVSEVNDEVRGRHQPCPALLEDETLGVEIPRPVMIAEGGEGAATTTQGMRFLKVDLTIFVFRRELEPSADLHPYDSCGAQWNPISYLVWTDLYHNFAPTMQEECAAHGGSNLPRDACTLFRRVMRTHYGDCGILFGRVWWDFGLGAMVGNRVNLRSFMRGMLTDMFMAYHALPAPPSSIRTLFNPRTYDPGHRMCAHCLTLTLGHRRMMRCPCGQVYYCDARCQRAHWRVHKLVCEGKK